MRKKKLSSFWAELIELSQSVENTFGHTDRIESHTPKIKTSKMHIILSCFFFLSFFFFRKIKFWFTEPMTRESFNNKKREYTERNHAWCLLRDRFFKYSYSFMRSFYWIVICMTKIWVKLSTKWLYQVSGFSKRLFANKNFVTWIFLENK